MTAKPMPRTNSATSSRAWFHLVLLAMAAAYIPAMASESTNAHEQYRVLQWKDLVPKGWKRPLIARAYNADVAIDKASVVQDLDGQLAALPGFMQPVVFEGNRVSEFLLVPFLPHRTFSPLPQNDSCAYPHFEPNQKVYVYALEPVVLQDPFKPIWIVGAMSLEPVITDSGPVAYRMGDAVTTPYQK